MAMYVSMHGGDYTFVHLEAIDGTTWTKLQSPSGETTLFFNTVQERMEFWASVAQGASLELAV
jgi:hypothetical protein